jgi:hypothetical protein
LRILALTAKFAIRGINEGIVSRFAGAFEVQNQPAAIGLQVEIARYVPEILSSSSPVFCPIGADVGHLVP